MRNSRFGVSGTATGESNYGFTSLMVVGSYLPIRGMHNMRKCGSDGTCAATMRERLG